MGKYLVCYFSATGTTRAVGEQIAEAIGADQWEIRPEKPFSEKDLNWRRYFARCNREHRKNKYPAVANPMKTVGEYGIVFLGFPIWYETAPNIIFSFLRTNNWTGQRIVLFATSGGSSISKAREDIRAFLGKNGDIPTASILDPLSSEKVSSWAINALDLITKKIRTDAEAYVKQNYIEPVPVVKEDQVPYDKQTDHPQPDSKTHFSRATSDIKYSSVLTPGETPDDKKQSGAKFSRDLEPKYSLDLNPENDLLAEIRRLRKENEALRRRQESIQRAGLSRSVLDRYNPGSIEQVLRNASTPASRSSALRTLDAFTDQSFVGKLMALIREKGMKEPEVYRAAQIDRKLFSKITSDQDYKPAKDTCIALAYALRLTLEEANDLLSRAGYTLSHSNKRDVILEYFFSAGKYNLFDVNEVLSQLNQRPLGRQS